MKTNYFTKIENKYVFNISLIIWHFLIFVASLCVITSSLFFLWGIIPATKKKVDKLNYPEKTTYPSPITVSLEDLKLKPEANIRTPSINDIKIEPKQNTKTVKEDLTGKKEFDLMIDSMKILIPPYKYSWEGKGYYEYPRGKNYWDYYQTEVYRNWIVLEEGLLDKLTKSFNRANADNYVKKTELLKGFTKLLSIIPENVRIKALDYLTSYVAPDVKTNNININAIFSVANKISFKNEENLKILALLSFFCINNIDSGISFVNYIASIIDKFDNSQQLEAVIQIRNSYYSYFDQDINILKDATDLYIPLLASLGINDQANTLSRYYNVFIKKNNVRNSQIRQIEFDYQKKIDEIDNKYQEELVEAQTTYEYKKFIKEKLRYKSLIGLGAGVIMFVLIGTFLAFLSIQRSVRKMEEHISESKKYEGTIH